MIRVKQTFSTSRRDSEFFAPGDGQILVTQLSTGINLEWAPVFWTDQRKGVQGYQGNSKITYTVVATKDSRARLDS